MLTTVWGVANAFLTRFDTDGDHKWALGWGDAGSSACDGIGCDGLGNVYVCGKFTGTSLDFNPGAGTDYHSSAGNWDAYVSKFGSDGSYKWGLSWGSANSDTATNVFPDGNGNVYVSGAFYSIVDFDPDPLEGENRTSNGLYDAYLSKFDSSGDFKWVNSWGGTGDDVARGAAVDGTGYIYEAGYFKSTVDFDPSPLIDFHVSNGDADAYLVKFDSGGGYLWGRTWGSTGSDSVSRVRLNPFSYNPCVAGSFNSPSVEFAQTEGPCSDPSDMHSTTGVLDGFVAKYLPDGCW
jgi:hypothetical protein